MVIVSFLNWFVIWNINDFQKAEFSTVEHFLIRGGGQIAYGSKKIVFRRVLRLAKLIN